MQSGKSVQDKPGAQYRDHPNMVAGRAALPRLLADFVSHGFGVQCPTQACQFQTVPAGEAPFASAGSATVTL
jgi:hypothetical protein